MMELPSITIVVTTYLSPEDVENKRGRAATQTLQSWCDYLRKYSGGINLHIADDGSEKDGVNLPTAWLRSATTRITYSRQHRKGVGASLNAGFRRAFESSPLVAYFVDDWALIQPFDLTPWAQLLMEREDVGMVRLGPPHPGTAGVVEMFTENWQGWGLRLSKHQGFAFGHRPALYHKRLMDAYGWFEEGVSALECERLYNEKVNNVVATVDIVQALPHPWQHIDTPSLSALEPK